MQSAGPLSPRTCNDECAHMTSVRTKFRRLLYLLALLIAAPVSAAQNAAPPRAPEPQVDVNLVLAVDASGSVSQDRFELQKQGYASAFRNPKVLAAIRQGNYQSISVSMLQWTGPTLHVVVVPWMTVRDQRSALALSAAIEAAPRRIFGGGTSLSGAIDYSVIMLTAAPTRAQREIVDISGDGSNNIGRLPTQARDEAVKFCILINGLPSFTLFPYTTLFRSQNVIGGPGAFVIAAKT